MRVSGGRAKYRIRLEFIFLCVIISGIITGTLGFMSAYSEAFSDFFFGSEISENSVKFSWAACFFKSFLGNSAFVFAVFLCGLSAVMQPFVLAIDFVKGLGLGILICSIYSAWGTDGMIMAAFLVVLPSLFFVFALVIASREAVLMSFAVAGALFTERNFIGLKDASRLYFAKFFVLESVAAVGAFADCLCRFLYLRF